MESNEIKELKKFAKQYENDNVYEKVFEIAFIKILDCYRLADEESGDALLQSLNIEKPVNLEFAMVFDKMFKLLQLGIPDEEFESLMNHIKTTEVNK